jgi:hypothetical protein
MKIVLSDIDGVLNCKSTKNPCKFLYLANPLLVKRLCGVRDRTRHLDLALRPGRSV